MVDKLVRSLSLHVFENAYPFAPAHSRNASISLMILTSSMCIIREQENKALAHLARTSSLYNGLLEPSPFAIYSGSFGSLRIILKQVIHSSIALVLAWTIPAQYWCVDRPPAFSGPRVFNIAQSSHFLRTYIRSSGYSPTYSNNIQRMTRIIRIIEFPLHALTLSTRRSCLSTTRLERQPHCTN